jgi:quercetin dioxygenase-like cupin family protein
MTQMPFALPRAIHRGENDLPFVPLGDGTHIQVLQIDIDAGLWVLRTRFEPGVTIARHKHTGPVFAVTYAGAWKYKEYPEVNVAGSYLYEPARSVHTLTVPEDQEGMTDVWFAIYGANLNLDADGNVTDIIDAGLIYEVYLALCAERGLPKPNVILGRGIDG